MSNRTSFSISLCLLVILAHVMGVTAAASPAVKSADAMYFCCCIGECSCTGDCCNHGPEAGTHADLGSQRVGMATPALQSQKNCGVWLGTPHRSPEQPSDARADAPKWPIAGPDQTGPQNFQTLLIPSIECFLRAFSPRGPPSANVLS